MIRYEIRQRKIIRHPYTDENMKNWTACRIKEIQVDKVADVDSDMDLRVGDTLHLPGRGDWVIKERIAILGTRQRFRLYAEPYNDQHSFYVDKQLVKERIPLLPDEEEEKT